MGGYGIAVGPGIGNGNLYQPNGLVDRNQMNNNLN